MSVAGSVAAAVQAALARGAARAEAYHRRSRSRFLIAGPDAVSTGGTRLEEGLAVRAWAGEDLSAPAGFAASTAEGNAEARSLGERAAESALVHAGVPDARPAATEPASDERVLDLAARAAGENTAAPGEGVAGTDGPTAAGLGLYDPRVPALTPAEIRRTIDHFVEACGAMRRGGIPFTPRVEMQAATIDTTLRRAVDGELRSSRATLISFQIRFPTAFGLSKLEIVARRVDELQPALLSRALSNYPVRADSLARALVDPEQAGEVTIILSPPLAAALVVELSRRILRRGRPLAWSTAGRIIDDPLLRGAPGSSPFDGEGIVPVPTVLAAPDDEIGDGPVRLNAVRGSVREVPCRGPSNLVLRSVPPGGVPMDAPTLHLLEAVSWTRGGLLARGVLRRPGEDARAMLVLVSRALEALFNERLRGRSFDGFLAVGAFASAPELIIPGVRVDTNV